MNVQAENTRAKRSQADDNIIVMQPRNGQDELLALRKKFIRLKAAYQHAIDKLDREQEQNDFLVAELCGKNIKLERVSKQLSELRDEHVWLSVAYEMLEEQDMKKRKKRERISALTERLRSAFSEVKRIFAAALVAFTKRSVAFREKLISDKNPAETNIAKPEARWFPMNRVLPAFTGMYRVSDGKTSSVSYFDKSTVQFAQQAFQVKFWSIVDD